MAYTCSTKVCFRFGLLIHRVKFVLGFGWAYTELGGLYTEGSLC